MKFDRLKSWSGSVEVSGQKFDSVQDAQEHVLELVDDVDTVTLHRSAQDASRTVLESPGSKCFIVSVRKYMTQPAAPGFDFMAKWNNNVPMPLMTMTGTIIRETPGMYMMDLHGDLVADCGDYCMRCGRPITNPVSKYFGMGPECGQHNYVNPFNSTEELKKAVENYRRTYLQSIKWKGWIIKSAITFMGEVKKDV